MGEGNCACGAAPKLILACSGAADVGAVADQAARRLTKEGKGRMYCLAGLGGDVESIVETTKAASGILVIDGCPVDCARKTVERVGLSSFGHIRVTDLGFEKGKTPVTDESIGKVAAAGVGKLA